MQHRVQGVSGKDLIRALHEAPEDMAAWLDPAASGDVKTIQEGMKDERFKALREGLVRTIAERSVSFSPTVKSRGGLSGNSSVMHVIVPGNGVDFRGLSESPAYLGLVRVIAGGSEVGGSSQRSNRKTTCLYSTICRLLDDSDCVDTLKRSVLRWQVSKYIIFAASALAGSPIFLFNATHIYTVKAGFRSRIVTWRRYRRLNVGG